MWFWTLGIPPFFFEMRALAASTKGGYGGVRKPSGGPLWFGRSTEQDATSSSRTPSLGGGILLLRVSGQCFVTPARKFPS